MVEFLKSILDITSDALTELDVDVITASHGQEAWSMIAEHDLIVDMVITDLEMSVMNGRQLCRRIRAHRKLKRIPVVFFANNTDSTTEIGIFKDCASDYLVKPFMKELFLARISLHLKNYTFNERLREMVEKWVLNRR